MQLSIKTIPNPGSDTAIKQGCKCAIMDNNYGRGRDTGSIHKPVFVVTLSCPLHGDKSSWGK